MLFRAFVGLSLLLGGGWHTAKGQKAPQGKITPYSLVEVDTIQVFNYTWRTTEGSVRSAISRYAPRETFSRIILTDLGGKRVVFPLNSLVRKELVPYVRPYASLPLDPVRPGYPLGLLRRVGYRKLAPYSSLADVRLSSGWLYNTLVLAPIAERLELLTPDNRILVLPGDSVLQWRRPKPDTAIYTTSGRILSSAGRKTRVALDLYVELAGGVAYNLSGRDLIGSYNYGWYGDNNLTSIYLTSGVCLWRSLLIGMRLGLEIPLKEVSMPLLPTTAALILM